MSVLAATLDLATLTASLIRRAEALGQVRAARKTLGAAASETLWRRADLLWPMFTRG